MSTFRYNGEIPTDSNVKLEGSGTSRSTNRRGSSDSTVSLKMMKAMIKNVVISSNVTSIEDRAFMGWESVQYVEFEQPSSIETIGRMAFYGCSSLLKIHLPSSVKSIGDRAFQANQALQQVTFTSNSLLLSSSLFTVAENTMTNATSDDDDDNDDDNDANGDGHIIPTAVANFSAEKSYTTIMSVASSYLSSSVSSRYSPSSQIESIGDEAFSQCTSLQQIIIPASVQLIGVQAFFQNSSLERITVLSDHPTHSITEFSQSQSIRKLKMKAQQSLAIAERAFSECHSLKIVNLGNWLSHLGEHCFSHCRNLEEVKMGCQGSITIGKRVFEGNVAMENIEITSPNSIQLQFAPPPPPSENQRHAHHGVSASHPTPISEHEGGAMGLRPPPPPPGVGSGAQNNGQVFLSKYLYTPFAGAILEWTLLRSRSDTLISLNSLKSVEFQLLVQTLKRSRTLVSLMGQMQSDRRVVLVFMLDAYANTALIFVFSFTAAAFFQNNPNYVLTLLSMAMATYFGLRELWQLGYEQWRLYFFNFWNYTDLARISLVLASSIRMLSEQDDSRNGTISNSTRQLLLWTGVSVIVGTILFLRNATLPGAKFVGGLIAVTGTLWPFVFVSSLMVFAFGYVFFALGITSEDCGDDGVCTLSQSVFVNFSFLFGGPGLTSSPSFDLAFGFAVVVVLLNVLIAVVSDAWEDSVEQGVDIFFGYRLAFLAEVESLSQFMDEVVLFCHRCFQYSNGPPPRREGMPLANQLANDSSGVSSVRQMPERKEKSRRFAWLRAYLDSRAVFDGVPWNEFPYSFYDNFLEYTRITRSVHCRSTSLDIDIKKKLGDDESYKRQLLEGVDKLQTMFSFERDWHWAGKNPDILDVGAGEEGQEKEDEGDGSDAAWGMTRFHVVLYFILYLTLLILGVVTCGLTWPQRFREDLFSIPFSEHDNDESSSDDTNIIIEEDKDDAMIESEIHKFKYDIKERLDAMETLTAKQIEAKLEDTIEKKIKGIKSDVQEIKNMLEQLLIQKEASS